MIKYWKINASGGRKRRKNRSKNEKTAFSVKTTDTPDNVLKENGQRARKTFISGNGKSKKSRKKFSKPAKNLLHRKKDSCIIPMLSVQG